MLLSYQDIERIKKLGFDTNFFVTGRDGWLKLKNQDGRCVFHNSIMCTIYEKRPDGCKLYPIIYDKDEKHAIFDKDCPKRDKFYMSKSITKQLYDLVLKIEIERAERKKLKMKW
jgi:Fe-S-cluster containining protein